MRNHTSHASAAWGGAWKMRIERYGEEGFIANCSWMKSFYQILHDRSLKHVTYNVRKTLFKATLRTVIRRQTNQQTDYYNPHCACAKGWLSPENAPEVATYKLMGHSLHDISTYDVEGNDLLTQAITASPTDPHCVNWVTFVQNTKTSTSTNTCKTHCLQKIVRTIARSTSELLGYLYTIYHKQTSRLASREDQGSQLTPSPVHYKQGSRYPFYCFRR